LLFSAVAALAFVIRLMPFLTGGGLGSCGRYDDGACYAASDALTLGRVPYRDFVFVHPPGHRAGAGCAARPLHWL
jgi:alpha-1,2-mannosyltransferase